MLPVLLTQRNCTENITSNIMSHDPIRSHFADFAPWILPHEYQSKARGSRIQPPCVM